MTPGQAAYEQERRFGKLTGRYDPEWDKIPSQHVYWESIAQEAVKAHMATVSVVWPEPLRWSSDPPTVPGWYWWKSPDGFTTVMDIHLAPFPDGNHLAVSNGEMLPAVKCSDYRGLWAGPIQPPVEDGK